LALVCGVIQLLVYVACTQVLWTRAVIATRLSVVPSLSANQWNQDTECCDYSENENW